MQFINDLTFTNLWSGPVFLCVGVLITALLFFAFYRFSIPTHRRTRTILALLRTFLVLIIVFALMDPYWKEKRDAAADWMGVLVDTSGSMNVPSGTSPLSRLDAAKQFLEQDPFWKRISQKYAVKIFAFDSEMREAADTSSLSAASGRETAMISVLQAITEKYGSDSHLLGWVLLSDGNAVDWNPENSRALNELPFPWVTVGMGQDGAVPNVRMLDPLMKDRVFAGDQMPVKVRWEIEGDPSAKTFLIVRLDGSEVVKREIVLGTESVDIEVPVKEPGDHSIDIELVPLDTEGSDKDNGIRSWVHADKRVVRVFYAESYYKDENMFKKALEQEGGFQVDFASSLLGFAKEKRIPFIKDPTYGFPKTREDLFRYDVVVLSDVKRNLLSNDQIGWIRELVEKQGGALIMVGGLDSFGDGGYVGTEIEKMLPVEISEEYKKDTFLKARGASESPFRPIIPPGSETHPLLDLTRDSEKNKQLWSSMPPLGGFNYVGRLKPGASCLLQHPTETSHFGPRVILALQSYGVGKVLAFTSDITPNWGEEFQGWKQEGDGWLYAKLWRRALKWLTNNRLEKDLTLIDIRPDPHFPSEADPVRMRLNITDGSLQEVWQKITLEITKEGGVDADKYSKEFLRPQFQKKIEWEIGRLGPGDYRLKAVVFRGNLPPLTLEKLFAVKVSDVESKHLETRHDLLQKIAESSRGGYLSFSDISRFETVLLEVQAKDPRQYASPFWNQAWIYLLILSILFTDWFLRKKQGLE